MRAFSIVAVLTLCAVGVGEVAQACGSKFLVGGRTNRKLLQVLANTRPATLLVYWRQNDTTAAEDRWSPNAEEFLRDKVGHTVTVVHDRSAFLAAAGEGEFDVVMALVDDARAVKADVARLLPSAAILPIHHLANRDEERDTRLEFGNVLRTPVPQDVFLKTIEKSRRLAQSGND